MNQLHRLIGLMIIIGLAAGAAGCSSDAEPVRVYTSQTAETASHIYDEDGLTFAVACEDEPETTYEAYQPLAEYLSREMGIPVTLCIKEGSDQVESMLLSGDADLARISAGSYRRLVRDMNPGILALESSAGTTRFHSCVIVRADSPVENFDQLQGKSFALVDKISNTGYAYPLQLAEERGADLNDYFCQVVFSGSHGKSIRAVYNGEVDGAAVASYVLEGEELRNPEMAAAIKVIQQSPAMTRGPYVAGKYLPPEQAARLTEKLLDMKNDPEGRQILAGLGLDAFRTGSGADYETDWAVVSGITKPNGLE